MIDSYITVSRPGSGEIIISKSRFIGYAAPSDNEDNALAFLDRIRNEHKSARHHCYAYIIGENSGIMRYSDDGEPGGTAGLPIMDVMKGRNIVNCCLVVVRYFGGILLGTGGLVRAYTQSALAALESAGVVRMELTSDDYCELPYSVWDKFRYTAEHLPVRLDNIEYGSSVSFDLLYRPADSSLVLPALLDASERKLESIHQGESFSAWNIDE